jgi:pimeloyl-ACP methyl ester carboxylesterase
LYGYGRVVDSFTRQGLTFDVTDVGPADGPVVIALHGFPQDRSCWEGITPALTGAGYRVLAPDQRGYSPRARPTGRSRYRIEELARDVLSMADHAGADRFSVVGHDWGAVVAWNLGVRYPDRIVSLAALSVPHPRAFLGSLLHSRQALMSWYMLAFQLPLLPERSLGAGGGEGMVRALTGTGLPEHVARRYAARAAEPSGMTGPLNWYRALPWSARSPLGPVEVPTLFVYGEGDTALSRAGADACGDWVTGPYAYETIAGGGHWLPEVAADRVAELVVAHLGRAG